MHDELTRQARPTLLVLLATTGFVLLLVAANIANLALARVIGRERELALRSALGAGRGRIARQLLTESTLLALAGGALGLARRLAGARSARRLHVALHAARRGNRHRRRRCSRSRFGVSVFTGLLFGLLPAFTRRTAASVKDAGHRTVGSRRLGARNALIVAQVAISFVLLVGAGLLVRSFIKLQQVDAGFRTDRVLTALVSLDFVKYNTAGRRAAPSTGRCWTRSSAEPGLRVGGARHQRAARSGGAVSRRVHRRRAGAGRPARAAAGRLQVRVAGLLQDDRHDAAQRPRVHRRRRRQTRRRWRSSTCRWRATTSRTPTPVGRRVSLDNGRTWMTIVGIVNDTHDYGLAEKPTDELYRRLRADRAAERVAAGADRGRSRRPSRAAFQPSCTRSIPASRSASIRTLEAIRSHSLAPPRLTAMLVTLFAARRADHHRGRHRRRRLLLGQPADDGDRRADGARRAARERRADDRAAGADAGRRSASRCGLAGALMMTRVVARLLFAVEPTDPIDLRGGRHRAGGRGGARVPRAGAARGGDRSDAGAARGLVIIRGFQDYTDYTD